MRILLSNDDGYFAPGIAALHAALEDLAEILVVAPERDKSGASNSLTLDRPLSMRKATNGFHFVNGTPSDCVHLALTGMLQEAPDMVVSGINHGANMGDDTLYSGTVAAATEGYLFGIPSIAVSLVSKSSTDFAAAARVARELVEQFIASPWKEPVLLNVNVPEGRYEDLRGFQVTRLGKRHKAAPMIPAMTPRGEKVFWVGPAGAAAEAGEGTDFHAVSKGFVSVTPLQIDLTHNGQLRQVRQWLEGQA